MKLILLCVFLFAVVSSLSIAANKANEISPHHNVTDGLIEIRPHNKKHRRHHRLGHFSKHGFRSFTTAKNTHFGLSGSLDFPAAPFGLEGSIALAGSLSGNTFTFGGEIGLFGYVSAVKLKAGIALTGSVELSCTVPAGTTDLSRAAIGALTNWAKSVFKNDRQVKSMQKLTKAQLKLWQAEQAADRTNEEIALSITGDIRRTEAHFVRNLKTQWDQFQTNPSTALARFHRIILTQWAKSFLFQKRADEIVSAFAKLEQTQKDSSLDGAFSAFLHCSSDMNNAKMTRLNKAMCRFLKAGFFKPLTGKPAPKTLTDIMDCMKQLMPKLYGTREEIEVIMAGGVSPSDEELIFTLAVPPEEFAAKVNAVAQIEDQPYKVNEVVLTGSITLKAGWYSGTMTAEVSVAAVKKFKWERDGINMKYVPLPGQFLLAFQLAPWLTFTGAYQRGQKIMNVEMNTCIQATQFYQPGREAEVNAKLSAALAVLKTAVMSGTTSADPVATEPNKNVGLGAMTEFMKWVKNNEDLHEAVNLVSSAPIAANIFGGIFSGGVDIMSAVLDIQGSPFGNIASYICLGASFATEPNSAETEGEVSINFLRSFSASFTAGGAGVGISFQQGTGYSFTDAS